MGIDPLTEETIPFAEAARRLPLLRADRPVHPSTLWRWASHGLRGVRLETLRIGGTTCTSLEALQRFFEQIGPGVDNAVLTPQPRRSAGAVEKHLDKIGI